MSAISRGKQHGGIEQSPHVLAVNEPPTPARMQSYVLGALAGLAINFVPYDRWVFSRPTRSHEVVMSAKIACLQPIVGKGCFTAAMPGDFDRALAEDGAFGYRRLHWEAGMIGQALYLWVTAAGFAGIGIGCFFDDDLQIFWVCSQRKRRFRIFTASRSARRARTRAC